MGRVDVVPFTVFSCQSDWHVRPPKHAGAHEFWLSAHAHPYGSSFILRFAVPIVLPRLWL